MLDISELNENEILTTKVRRFVQKKITSELGNNISFCGEHLRAVTSDSASIWALVKTVDNQYHILHIELQFNIKEDDINTNAIINSPRLKDFHEVVSMQEEIDTVKYYIEKICEAKKIFQDNKN